VATTGPKGTVQVWDVATGQPLGPPLQIEDGLCSPWISPEGRRVFTTHSRQIRTWDVPSGRLLATIGADSGEVLQSFLISPDGQRVLTVTGPGPIFLYRTVQVWDAGTGQRLGRPIVHRGGIRTAEFSPDSQRILTGSMDWTARVWDATTGEAVTPPLIHGNWVEAWFSPDGRRVCTWAGDGYRIWNAATGELLSPLLPLGQGPGSPVFTPDASRLIAWEENGAARVWELSPDRRPIEEWLLLSRVLSGGRIDDTGSQVPMETARLEKDWLTLRERYAPMTRDHR
jgi:WD40 repeat protein